MVTHNPDVECYADRVLYVEDGCFQRQALNYTQTKLMYDQYIKFLNTVEGGHA
jgi:putative ABC transport system ATP-binding protein